MKYLVNILMLLAVAHIATAQSAPGWRLNSIATERYENGSFQPRDSATYFYSANHTGAPGWAWLDGIARSQSYRDSLYTLQPALQYDSVWAWRGNGQNGYSKALTYSQTFNNNTIVMRGRYSSGNLTAQETYTYAGGYLTEKEVGGMKYTFHYTATYQPDTMRVYEWLNGTGPWTLKKSVYYTYDVNNKITEAYTDSGIAHTIAKYLYNGSGQLEYTPIIKGGAVPDDTAMMYTYTYTGGDAVTETIQISNTAGNLENYMNHLCSYDNNHNKTEDITRYWNSTITQWDTSGRGLFTYNSNNNLPESYTSLQWDKTTGTWVPMGNTDESRNAYRIRLHYDLFWPVGIAGVPVNNTAIRIYPVPVAGIMNIQASFSQAQSFTLTITDMQGRVLRKWSEPKIQTYQRALPVADLPTGNYILSLQGEKEQAVRQFVVN